jgi:hypothetical protein
MKSFPKELAITSSINTLVKKLLKSLESDNFQVNVVLSAMNENNP